LNTSLTLNISAQGVEIVKGVVPANSLETLLKSFPQGCHNRRNGLDYPAVREIACSSAIRDLVIPTLGTCCFAVRAVLFNKSSNSNWKVAWHQDVVIAVKARVDLAGFGPWSIKQGVVHVRPPGAILENMLAVRLHLDDCGEDNGPLRVLPATHNGGIFSDSEINALPKTNEIVCKVRCGDAILMRPLTVHASSAARKSSSRRVVHIEFAVGELPQPLAWHDAARPTFADAGG
jgi:ectoine hydroxylase-related dioxygenase (phytanoyl-CoA dioxygenase family)